MRAVTGEPDLLRRLPIELLARTGMRVGELCDLEDDCVTQIGDSHWLRIPVGKLHNDRYVPLHPHLVHLIVEYRHIRPAGATGRLLVRPDGQPLERYWVARALTRTGKQAGHRPCLTTPTAAHSRYPGHQPGDEPRSHRRPAGS